MVHISEATLPVLLCIIFLGRVGGTFFTPGVDPPPIPGRSVIPGFDNQRDFSIIDEKAILPQEARQEEQR